MAAVSSPVHTYTILLSFVAVTLFRAVISFMIYYGAISFMADATILQPLPFFMLLGNTVVFFSLVGLRSGLMARDFADAGALENTLINIGISLSGSIYSLDMISNPFVKNVVKFNPVYYLTSSLKHYFWGCTNFVPPMGTNLVFFGVNILAFLYLARLFDNSPNIRS
jgi:ABC-2 type transport system permease protein